MVEASAFSKHRQALRLRKRPPIPLGFPEATNQRRYHHHLAKFALRERSLKQSLLTPQCIPLRVGIVVPWDCHPKRQYDCH